MWTPSRWNCELGSLSGSLAVLFLLLWFRLEATVKKKQKNRVNKYCTTRKLANNLSQGIQRAIFNWKANVIYDCFGHSLFPRFFPRFWANVNEVWKVIWDGIVLLLLHCDWSRKLPTFSQPIRCKTLTKQRHFLSINSSLLSRDYFFSLVLERLTCQMFLLFIFKLPPVTFRWMIPGVWWRCL